jgi:hypothetical protein
MLCNVDACSLHLFQGITNLALENILSDAADVAGIANNCLATSASFGYLSVLAFHHNMGSILMGSKPDRR